VSAAALTVVGGCTAETSDVGTEHAETTIAAIVGGQATSAYPAVGALTRWGSFGDSGGPAFAADSEGKLFLAGVTSFGDRDCAKYGVDTRVDAYTSFIAAAQN
jgi:secreted trypsin-like serine protease